MFGHDWEVIVVVVVGDRRRRPPPPPFPFPGPRVFTRPPSVWVDGKESGEDVFFFSLWTRRDVVVPFVPRGERGSDGESEAEEAKEEEEEQEGTIVVVGVSMVEAVGIEKLPESSASCRRTG